jgi:hypothetical protein
MLRTFRPHIINSVLILGCAGGSATCRVRGADAAAQRPYLVTQNLHFLHDLSLATEGANALSFCSDGHCLFFNQIFILFREHKQQERAI